MANNEMMERFLREHGESKGRNGRSSRAVSKVRFDGRAQPMSQPNALPPWSEPGDLKAAAGIIAKLGRSMHEHAYLLGKHLLWVRDSLGTTKFEQWVADELWFTDRTAYRMMAFAKRCDIAEVLLSYHPGKGTDTMSPLAPRKSAAVKHLPAPKTATVADLPSEANPTDEPVPPSDPAEDAPLPPEEDEPVGLERFDFIQPPTDPEEKDGGSVPSDVFDELSAESLFRDVERVIRRGFPRLPIGEQSKFIQRIVALVNDVEIELGL